MLSAVRLSFRQLAEAFLQGAAALELEGALDRAAERWRVGFRPRCTSKRRPLHSHAHTNQSILFRGTPEVGDRQGSPVVSLTTKCGCAGSSGKDGRSAGQTLGKRKWAPS